MFRIDASQAPILLHGRSRPPPASGITDAAFSPRQWQRLAAEIPMCGPSWPGCDGMRLQPCVSRVSPFANAQNQNAPGFESEGVRVPRRSGRPISVVKISRSGQEPAVARNHCAAHTRPHRGVRAMAWAWRCAGRLSSEGMSRRCCRARRRRARTLRASVADCKHFFACFSEIRRTATFARSLDQDASRSRRSKRMCAKQDGAFRARA